MEDAGSHPTLKLSSFLRGVAGPSSEANLCDSWLPLEVRQNGKISCPPKKGHVEISWTTWTPTSWKKTGFYKIRAEMYTTTGVKMTDFESTMWIDGKDHLRSS
jgi:hypothetical protein